ncbi:CDP-glycerol glycerophosphotransferase family protein [Rossellomorea vietnamensis]|uniref:CDP-glycerol glycerophosphotransferase family protein n=1 Tax=Rossellomorea vietnamensis TaxID=218284 RepID=UPI000553A26B|nr:CDP-glycerol glycerophosphotransferase family protein [Rossellomorea vietnamensis]
MKNIVEPIKRMIILCIIHLFNLLPIKNNKIFLFSYYGAQYGDNPKYISEYIKEHDHQSTYDIVWAFTDLDSTKHITDIRKVKMMSLRYFYELCTSKIIITNFRTTDYFIKRRNQYYVQTWHSSLRLKQIEKDAETALPPHYVEMAKRDSKKCDLLLSGCRYSTEIFKRAFWYEGEIFESGIPRNDVLLRDNQDKVKAIKHQYNLSVDTKVLLYAPTFRKDHSLDVYDLEYDSLIKAAKKKFGGDWVVLIKLHPHLISKSNQMVQQKNVIDVTAYNDIQELLLIADVLISDYSSLMFDYSLTNRPCFLYVPDVKQYLEKERSFYFNLKELPFISAQSNVDLVREMELFDELTYKQEVQTFLSTIGSYERGISSKLLFNKINEVCFGDKRRGLHEAI